MSGTMDTSTQPVETTANVDIEKTVFDAVFATFSDEALKSYPDG